MQRVACNTCDVMIDSLITDCGLINKLMHRLWIGLFDESLVVSCACVLLIDIGITE